MKETAMVLAGKVGAQGSTGGGFSCFHGESAGCSCGSVALAQSLN
jgi:hypothetical protein